MQSSWREMSISFINKKYPPTHATATIIKKATTAASEGAGSPGLLFRGFPSRGRMSFSSFIQIPEAEPIGFQSGPGFPSVRQGRFGRCPFIGAHTG